MTIVREEGGGMGTKWVHGGMDGGAVWYILIILLIYNAMCISYTCYYTVV